MKCTAASLAVLLSQGSGARAEDETANPLSKVLQLMGDLSAKVTQDGYNADKAYHEYTQWCDDTAATVANTIKTSTNDKSTLEAKISELTSDMEVSTTNIGKLAKAIAEAEKELKEATAIRKKEAAIFAKSEKELMDAVDALDRAIGVLEKEMDKNPASLAQVDTSSMSGMLEGLSVVMDAASFSADDSMTLASLLQSQQAAAADDQDEEFGAPKAAAYKSKSGGIFDVLQDMKEKAEGQLSGVRQAEVKAKQSYKMLKQGLTDQTAADNKDLAEEKAGKAGAGEAKASAEGDLEKTTTALKESTKELATVRKTCISVAASHQDSVAARKTELEVIAKARKILEETTGGASKQSYSFVQVAASSGGTIGRKVLTVVKKLAKQEHSAALMQLASRISSVLRNHHGADPFKKVRGMVKDMIAKLETEMKEDAAEKAYCDEQLAKTSEKKGDLEDDIAKMTNTIDTAVSKSAKLKQQIRGLETDLSALAKEQADMDKIRGKENAAYKASKADLEQGLSGVRKALDVLRDYYSGGSSALVQEDDSADDSSDEDFKSFMQQPKAPVKAEKSAGAGGGIIDILTIVESDFAKDLATEETEESTATSEYDKMTQENKVAKATMEQDVKYKTAEVKSLAATISEVSSDRDTANTELSAVNEYWKKIQDRCIAKPETYEERAARRAKEIAGLKQALNILENEAAFVQRKRRGSFRGSLTSEQ